MGHSLQKRTTMALLLFILAWCAHAGQGTVTCGVDTGAASLRAMVGSAAKGDTIVFNIPHTDTVLLADSIVIAKSMTLLGRNRATGGNTVVEVASPGVSKFRVFKIGTADDTSYADAVVLKNMVLRGGRIARDGGVILFLGTLIMDSVTVRDGICENSCGGGISTDVGHLFLSNCSVINNKATASTGSGTNASLTGSPRGGGIYSRAGQLSIVNSTISDNEASTFDSAAVEFHNSSSANGGGIYVEYGTTSIESSSICGNAAYCSDIVGKAGTSASGGGIFILGDSLAMQNCLVASNKAYCRHTAQASTFSSMGNNGGGIFS
jgi:predicted outer membrane repeat protein